MGPRVVAKLTAGIRRRLLMLVTRGVVRSLDDGTGVQSLKIEGFDGETLATVERFQNFGFTGVPPDGAGAIVVCPGGNRSHAIVIALDHREKRKKDLKEGESAVYDAYGKFLYLKDDGSMELVAEDLLIKVAEGEKGGSGKVTVEAEGDVEVKTDGGAKVEARGDIELKSDGEVSIEGSSVSIEATTIDISATATLTMSAAAAVTISGTEAVEISSQVITIGTSLSQITIGGIDWKTHRHNGVESGDDVSGIVHIPAP